MANRILEVEEIKKIIPHRYPFLFVDRVEITEPGEACVGRKCITANEEVFNGHFPGRPTFPGFLMLEAMAQTAIIVGKVEDEDPTLDLVLLAGADNAKFKRQVVPGDVLELHVRKIAEKAGGKFLKFSCEAKVEGVVCASANLSAMKVPVEK